MEDSQSRARAIKIIGGFYMLVGLFMLLTGAAALASTVLIDSAGSGGVPAAMEGAPKMLLVVLVVVRYFGAVGFFQMIVGVAVIISANNLMKRSAWARTALEVFTWLSLVAAIIIGSVWAYSWAKMTSSMPPEMTAPLSPGNFAMIGAALWAGLAVVVVVASAVLIRFLRDESLRKALS